MWKNNNKTEQIQMHNTHTNTWNSQLDKIRPNKQETGQVEVVRNEEMKKSLVKTAYVGDNNVYVSVEHNRK